MQASSLLLPQDRSIGQVNISGLSDQIIMEVLIDGFDDSCKQQFKHHDGTYKDVCKWRGIKCNGRRQVTAITWLEKDSEIVIDGAVPFTHLPANLKTFIIEMPGSANRDLDFEDIEASALPHSLEYFALENVGMGSFDLRRLPPNLKSLKAISSGVFGSCCLTALPKGLKELNLKHNDLTGSICLDRLPHLMWKVNLSFNALSGSINLKRLPSTLSSLWLDHNEFCGNIDANYLPQKLELLFLSDNKISGTFSFTCPPMKLQLIRINGNAFTGLTTVSRNAFPFVDADYAAMGGVVDETGVPYAENVIQRTRKERNDALLMGFVNYQNSRNKSA